MRLIMVLVLLILGTGRAVAETNSNSAALLIQESDGNNAGRYRTLTFCNGSTLNPGNGSIIITSCGTYQPNALTFLYSQLTFNGDPLTFTP